MLSADNKLKRCRLVLTSQLYDDTWKTYSGESAYLARSLRKLLTGCENLTKYKPIKVKGGTLYEPIWPAVISESDVITPESPAGQYLRQRLADGQSKFEIISTIEEAVNDPRRYKRELMELLGLVKHIPNPELKEIRNMVAALIVRDQWLITSVSFARFGHTLSIRGHELLSSVVVG